MFYLIATLTLVLMTIVPIIVLIAIKYGEIVENLRKKFQDQLAQAGAIADESISNIRRYFSLHACVLFVSLYLGTIRIFGAEEKIKKNYVDKLFQSFVVGKKLAFNDGLFSGILGLLTAAGISAVM
jgi:ABC-type multidrug transport system fused ATPase/permease subunit